MIRTSVDEFGAVMRDFALNVVPESAQAIQEAVALQGLAGVIAMTPVDQGIARGGWQVAIGEAGALNVNAPDSNLQKAPLSDSAALSSSAYQAGERVITTAPPFALITIFNNVDYIGILEDGRVDGGFGGIETPFGEVTSPTRSRARGSIQAPNGMLGVTFTRLVSDLTTEVDVA